jgi:hypothetical protein
MDELLTSFINTADGLVLALCVSLILPLMAGALNKSTMLAPNNGWHNGGKQQNTRRKEKGSE